MTRKIRYKRLIIFLVILILIVFVVLKFLFLRISNIYVSGNILLSDQEIIELAGLSNYPISLLNLSNSIESRVSKSQYISSVKVSKKNFTRVYIDVVENRPLFYDDSTSMTIFSDGTSSSQIFNVPTLTNGVDSSIYEEFLKELSLIDLTVFNNISEIEYAPNNVDKKLFLFSMNDGNYIYANIDRFVSINKYFDMVVNFNNHKGILYLDSGEYFKILEN